MTINDIYADATEMLSGNVTDFGDLSDTELINLNRDAAIHDIEFDVRNIAGIAYNEPIDAMVAKDPALIARAMAYKQLFYYFMNANQGEGSRGFNQMRFYERQYSNIKTSFSKLAKPVGSAISGVALWL